MTVMDNPVAVATALKFAINRGKFEGMLTVAKQLINARSANPIYLCFKIAAQPNAVELSATDGEAGIRLKTHNCMVESIGEICLPAEKLTEIVSAIETDTVMISVTGETALVESKAGKFNIYTQAATAFPPFATRDDIAECSLPVAVMKRLLAQTGFAIPAEANAFAKQGTLFEIAADGLTLCATDCRMLAVANAALQSPLIASVIVPQKATDLLSGILDAAEDKVSIRAWENGAEFACGDAVIRTNLLEGTFPPYRDIIPKESDKSLVSATGPLVQALRLGMLMTSEETKAIACEMNPMAGLRISAAVAGKGNADIPLACRYTGAEFKIGINPKFLIAGIKAANCEEIKLEFSAGAQAHARPIKLEVPGYIFIVMPTAI